jgi:hypothetical protein
MADKSDRSEIIAIHVCSLLFLFMPDEASFPLAKLSKLTSKLNL